jgi:uncharacterized protein YndB with AHSA1/START domain
MRSQHSIFIRRPPGKVFAFIVDVASWKRWALRVVEVRRQLAGALQVGEQFTVVARLYGRDLPMTYQVTEIEPGRCLRFRSVAGPAGDAAFSFSVEPEGEGARVTESVELKPRGLYRVIAPLIKWTSDKQLAANHAALQRALEAG